LSYGGMTAEIIAGAERAFKGEMAAAGRHGAIVTPAGTGLYYTVSLWP